jgi:hypothetical protein
MDGSGPVRNLPFQRTDPGGSQEAPAAEADGASLQEKGEA